MIQRKYNVIDTFLFAGEIEMLKLRLDYLNDSVDYFIIAESNQFFTGESKNFEFLVNNSEFEKYEHKIHYVSFEPNVPEKDFEKQQRNSLRNKIIELADENSIILHSDVDEIPDKTKFEQINEIIKNTGIVSLLQKTYYSAPTITHKSELPATIAFTYNFFQKSTDLSSLRETITNTLESAGYHFSKFHKSTSGNIKKDELVISEQIEPIFPFEFLRHEIFFRNTFNRNKLKPHQILRKGLSSQIKLEIENLQLLVANKKPEVIVEIGTALGGTLARWFEIPSCKVLISIDQSDGIHGGQGFEQRTYTISDALEQANLTGIEFYAVNGDSKDQYLINRVSELLGDRKIDFLFIDGDHTFDGVKGDFEKYEHFLKEESTVALHDVLSSHFHRKAECYVSVFWEQLKRKYNYKEFIYTKYLDLTYLNWTWAQDASQNGGFGGIGVINYEKDKLPNLSLVMPIYNLVETAIENITITLSTSKQIDEVILYSNGTDETGNQKLKKFAESNNRIKLVIIDKPIGFIKAINNSLKLAKNELILCLNSDVNLIDNWEERLLPLCLDSKTGLIGPAMANNFILGCCIIFKKSVINTIGLLDEGFGLGYEEDVEYSKRVIDAGFNLGWAIHKEDFGYNDEIEFPINHKQGSTFKLFSQDSNERLKDKNNNKLKSFIRAEEVTLLDNLDYESVLEVLKDDSQYLVVNKSGHNFEKIRMDEEIISKARIFEITPEMNKSSIISVLTKGKKVKRINKNNNKSLTWLAKFDDCSSMGILSQKMLEQMHDIDFACKNIISEGNTKNPLILEALNKEINTNIGIMFSYPHQWKELNPFDVKVIFSGIDTTGGIIYFTENINHADFIITPSNLSRQRLINTGVTKPIFVQPHGIDPEVFSFQERKKTNKFKFLYVGEASDRKGIFQLLKAFESLFKDTFDVELHIKSNTEMLYYDGDRVDSIVKELPNVFWHVSDSGHDKLIELYKDCHVYVYPSRGDSFGMTVLEAMACGLPVISTSEPGVCELVKGRYFEVESTLVPVKGHPWMLGEWGQPSVDSLKSHMLTIFTNYKQLCSVEKLKANSDYVSQNYSWEKVTNHFKESILPKLQRKRRIITLVPSFNRKEHIIELMNSLKQLREDSIDNHIYIVENSNSNNRDEIIEAIKTNMDEKFSLYVSDFNLGQKGALLQMLEDINLDDYDFVQFTDQDNLFLEPLSTYCNILRDFKDIYYTTGYMSKEHFELSWRKSKYGNLCEKRALRAGHMFMRASDLKSILPIRLDSQYNKPNNSIWTIGIDWELSYWNKNAPGNKTTEPFVLCLPGGVLHKGNDSTWSDWDVQKFEYSLAELIELRNFNLVDSQSKEKELC